MKKQAKTHSADTIFVLSLFCVFAACVLLTLILGTRSHSAMKKAADEAYYTRTALSYITEKVRNADADGSVRVDEIDGIPALVLKGSYDGSEYETYIYQSDGMIKELFGESGVKLGAAAGNDVIECSNLTFSMDELLVTVSYTDPQGKKSSEHIFVRSGGGHES